MINEAFNFANLGDEFYTRIGDIQNEMSHYDLSNMVVYCNCDDPRYSNFYKYFKGNFKKLGLRGLLATYKSNNPILFEYDGTNEKKTPIDSGNFQDNNTIVDMCDIVVTNPPFSNKMVIDLIDTLLNKGKKFIIVGPLHLINKDKIFNYFKEGLINVGYSSINRYATEDGGGQGSPTCWWTNLEVNKPFFKTNYTYDEEIYPKYDNCDAIDSTYKEMIPSDYNGVIGTSIRFIINYNREQFDLVGKLDDPRINGKKLYTRLLIKHKNVNENKKKIVIIREEKFNKIFQTQKK